ncbi:MAG TPA: phosphatase PAP2 family protein [Gemmatimonadales bacterium]|jgi:membrane-associated phospholipid phosphatase|nr:phosphatase PAP2 family protein [Gemmatimonadales bacterium]
MRSASRFLVVAAIAIVAALLLDSWVWTHVADPAVYDHGLGRMLRTMGFLPFWLAAAVALWLANGGRRSALLLALVPTVGGAIDEVLKLLIRRERPGLHHGAYVFRSFSDRPMSSTDFGLPSSEAVVAFSAAWILCRLYPRAWPVWLALAAGCAITRLLAQAHFLSDVTVGAVVGYAIAAVAWRQWQEVRPVAR